MKRLSILKGLRTEYCVARPLASGWTGVGCDILLPQFVGPYFVCHGNSNLHKYHVVNNGGTIIVLWKLVVN